MLGWEARRRYRGWSRGVGGGVSGRVAPLDVQSVVGEDVSDGREAVVGLCCRDVVDMACLAETAGTVLGVAGVGLVARAEAGECVVQGCRLNDAVVGELGSGRGGD